jgi:hypothetical protein
LSTLRSTRQTLCQVPSASRPSSTGDGGVRRHDRRHHVRAAVAARPVRVPPAVVGRQQVAERAEQVVVAAGAGLDDRDAGRGVRDEQLQQPVPAVGHELLAVAGQVEDDLTVTGAVLACARLHAPIVARPAPRRRAARPGQRGGRPPATACRRRGWCRRR